MRINRQNVSRPVVTAVIAGVALAMAPVVQSGPAPTTVGDVTATAQSGGIAVSAPVDLGGQEPVLLAYDGTGDSPVTSETGAVGLDLTTAAAYVADGDEDVITFEWRVADLPSAPPPEGVRYYWEFAVNGGTEYALQVKFSDLASTNSSEDPQGFVEHVGNTFRLRGNCGSLTPVITTGNCAHVAWLTGEFDTENDTIRVHVPLNLAKATALRPGVRIDPDPTTTTTPHIWASFQAVLDNANTRDSMAQVLSYQIPTGTSFAELVDGDGAVVRTASLGRANGTASGTVPTAGLAAGDYTVRVRACLATNCATSSTPVTL